jgi:hypothetical protein
MIFNLIRNLVFFFRFDINFLFGLLKIHIIHMFRRQAVGSSIGWTGHYLMPKLSNQPQKRRNRFTHRKLPSPSRLGLNRFGRSLGLLPRRVPDSSGVNGYFYIPILVSDWLMVLVWYRECKIPVDSGVSWH